MICTRCKQRPAVQRRKSCQSCLEYSRQYDVDNMDRRRQYASEHREQALARQNKYRAKYMNRIKASYRRRRIQINARAEEIRKNKMREDAQFRIKRLTKNRISQALRWDYQSGTAIDALGCSIVNFKRHITSKFKRGMCWKNRGHSGWHIDHIIPLSAFDLTNRKQFKAAFNYKNTQPLWAKENARKGAKIK